MQTGASPTIPPPCVFTPTLENYAKIFVEEPFLKYFWNSLWIGLASALFSLAVGSLAAYSIARFRTGGQRIQPDRAGHPDAAARGAGDPLLSAGPAVRTCSTRVGRWRWSISRSTCPFVVWILIGFFQGIPRELEEAALVDGSGRLGAFWRIIVPLSLPGMLAAGVFAFVLSWNEFLFALVLTGRNSKTLPGGASWV